MASRDKVTHRKLMDWQTREAGHGPLLGILATTYELDPAFVEIDLLPALFGLGAWDDRSWASRVALEKALAEVEATTILVDHRRYRGRPRSPRIEVLPAVGSRGQLLHAKVLLVVHEHAVRFQVSSANLTEAGYRENREVALPLVASDQSPETAATIMQAAEIMPEVLARWWTQGAAAVHELAMERLRSWAGTPHHDTTIVWGGGATPLWKQVVDRWPAGQKIERISVVSPFWSEEGPNGPFTTLVTELRKTGSLAPGAKIELYTEAQSLSPGVFRPQLPTLGPIDPQALDVHLSARAVDPLPANEPGGRDVLRPRKLHAKVVILHGRSTALAYVGSANFTTPGWGFMTSPSAANVEAGVVFIRPAAVLGEWLLPPTTGKPVDIGPMPTVPVPTEEEDDASVPTFVRGVWLEPEPLQPDRLRLSVVVDPGRVHGAYSVSFVGEESGVLLASDTLSAAENYVALDAAGVSRLLADQQVRVRWWASSEHSDFPVNVAMSARTQLPVVQGCPNPGEQLLLAYYQGRISPTDLFPPPPGWEDGEDPPVMGSTITEVDTSRIQSYQVRGFVEALAGIRADLVAASKGTHAAMRLAVSGPVSPVALAKQVVEAWRRGDRGATAAGFQLVEVASCLREAGEADQSNPAWGQFLVEGRQTIELGLDDIARSVPEELGPESAFSRYAREVLGWKPKRGPST